MTTLESQLVTTSKHGAAGISPLGPKLTLSTLEICALTGLGRDHVQNLVRDGTLPNVSGNQKRILVPRIALERYLEQAGQ
jgi:excisionase family DNA binding protein